MYLSIYLCVGGLYAHRHSEVCVCMFVYLYTSTHIHTCIHTYIHTYIHTDGLNSQKADDEQPVEKNSTNFSAFTRGYPQPASKATGGGGYTHYTKRYPFPANMDDPYTTSDAAAIHGDIQHGMYSVRVCVSARAGVQYHSVGWPVSHAGGR